MTGRTLNNLASVLHLRGDVEGALSCYREARLAYQQLGDRRGLAETCHNLALVYREAGQREEAERESGHAMRHAMLAGEDGLLGLVMTGRAEVALAAGDDRVASEALQRAGRLAGQAGDAAGLAEVLRVRALVALRVDQPAAALADALAAREQAVALGSTLLQAESASVAARAATRLSRSQEAHQLREEARRLFAGLGAVAHLNRLDEAG